MKLFALFFIAALMAAPTHVAAQASGQERPHPAHRGAQFHSHSSADQFLRFRAELGLSEAQVRRLEQITRELQVRNRPLREQMEATGLPALLHQQRHGGREARLTRQQRKELEEKLTECRPLLLQLRENNHAAMAEARAVLTPEQKERLREIIAESKREQSDNPPQRGPRGRSGSS